MDGKGGPGGWGILDEPELHLQADSRRRPLSGEVVRELAKLLAHAAKGEGNLAAGADIFRTRSSRPVEERRERRLVHMSRNAVSVSGGRVAA
jgi:hypothetical protein